MISQKAILKTKGDSENFEQNFLPLVKEQEKRIPGRSSYYQKHPTQKGHSPVPTIPVFSLAKVRWMHFKYISNITFPYGFVFPSILRPAPQCSDERQIWAPERAASGCPSCPRPRPSTSWAKKSGRESSSHAMGVPEKEGFICDYDGNMIWDDMGYVRKYDGTYNIYRKILYVGIVWEHVGLFWSILGK